VFWGYIGIVQHKEHSPEVLSLPPGTPCIRLYSYIHTYIHTYKHTYIHTHTHTYTHLHRYVRTYTHIFTILTCILTLHFRLRCIVTILLSLTYLEVHFVKSCQVGTKYFDRLMQYVSVAIHAMLCLAGSGRI